MHEFEYFHYFDRYVKVVKIMVETIREKLKTNYM